MNPGFRKPCKITGKKWVSLHEDVDLTRKSLVSQEDLSSVNFILTEREGRD